MNLSHAALHASVQNLQRQVRPPEFRYPGLPLEKRRQQDD